MNTLHIIRLLIPIRYPIQTLSQPSAVFDLHFQPHPGKGDVFATVSSTGTLSIFKISVPKNDVNSSTKEGTQLLQPISVLRVPDLDEDVLFTYFAWHPSIPALVAITTASGQIILAHIHDDYQSLDVLENPILEHSLEAWVVAFSPSTPSQQSSPDQASKAAPPLATTNTIFSGGDDSILQYTTYDPASSDGLPTPYSPITVRDHTAGVTAILPLPLSLSNSSQQHIVLTGSYDDTLRVFAIAPLHTTYGAKRARLLAECNLGGGVWRLSVIGEPTISTTTTTNGTEWAVTVLASCMHAGTRVLRITGRDDDGSGSSVEIEILARFEEHKSMNYGSDWARLAGGGGESILDEGGRPLGIIVSTSFYDRLLCVWSMSN